MRPLEALSKQASFRKSRNDERCRHQGPGEGFSLSADAKWNTWQHDGKGSFPYEPPGNRSCPAVDLLQKRPESASVQGRMWTDS